MREETSTELSGFLVEVVKVLLLVVRVTLSGATSPPRVGSVPVWVREGREVLRKVSVLRVEPVWVEVVGGRVGGPVVMKTRTRLLTGEVPTEVPFVVRSRTSSGPPRSLEPQDRTTGDVEGEVKVGDKGPGGFFVRQSCDLSRSPIKSAPRHHPKHGVVVPPPHPTRDPKEKDRVILSEDKIYNPRLKCKNEPTFS